MNNNDAFFKKIAKTYVNNLGGNAKLENEMQHIAIDTDGLDKKFEEKLKVEKVLEKQKTSSRKINKFTRALMPLAACLVIVCIFAVIQGTLRGPKYASESPAAKASTAEESAAEEPVAEAESPASEEPASEAPADSEQILPFPALPDNIALVNQEIDGERVIYHLRDEHSNEIVLEMRYGQVDSQEISNTQETEIKGYKVYKEDTETQKKIVFEQDGIVYILTSDTDMDVLILICEGIL